MCLLFAQVSLNVFWHFPNSSHPTIQPRHIWYTCIIRLGHRYMVAICVPGSCRAYALLLHSHSGVRRLEGWQHIRVAHDSFYVCSKQIAFYVFNNLNEAFSAVQALQANRMYIKILGAARCPNDGSKWAPPLLLSTGRIFVQVPVFPIHVACSLAPALFIPFAPAKLIRCSECMNRNGCRFTGTTAIIPTRYMSPKRRFVLHAARKAVFCFPFEFDGATKPYHKRDWRFIHEWLIRMAAIPTKIHL